MSFGEEFNSSQDLENAMRAKYGKTFTGTRTNRAYEANPDHKGGDPIPYKTLDDGYVFIDGYGAQKHYYVKQSPDKKEIGIEYWDN